MLYDNGLRALIIPMQLPESLFCLFVSYMISIYVS